MQLVAYYVNDGHAVLSLTLERYVRDEREERTWHFVVPSPAQWLALTRAEAVEQRALDVAGGRMISHNERSQYDWVMASDGPLPAKWHRHIHNWYLDYLRDTDWTLYERTTRPTEYVEQRLLAYGSTVPWWARGLWETAK